MQASDGTGERRGRGAGRHCQRHGGHPNLSALSSLGAQVVSGTQVAFLQVFAAEVTRVALLTGTEGVLGGKAEVQGVSGEWKTLVDRVNTMAQSVGPSASRRASLTGLHRNLTDQVRSIARVTTAVANGDLTSYVEVDARGEIGQLRDTVNAMVLFLQTFASEMSRVTIEVGLSSAQKASAGSAFRCILRSERKASSAVPPTSRTRRANGRTWSSGSIAWSTASPSRSERLGTRRRRSRGETCRSGSRSTPTERSFSCEPVVLSLSQRC